MHVNPAIAALLAQLNNPSLPGIELSLGRMQALMAALGNPQLHLPPTVHVAGTNGKGSTIAFLRAMLEASGKRVHVYTSPHLVHFNERIRLAGNEISDAQLLPHLQRVASMAATHPVTFFEATTAAAFLAFAENPADVLLLEVGMGGRLDATNLVPQPVASVITPVAMDHQEFLGSTLAAIAAEKAGIIKQAVPVFSAVQQPAAAEVIAQAANALDAPLQVVPAEPCIQPGLAGEHQKQNAALAIAVAQQVFALDDDAIRQGLAQAHWPARLQKLRHGPLVAAWQGHGDVWLDGGHNAHAATMLADWATRQPAPVLMVLGLMARKDAAAFLKPLRGAVQEIACIAIPGDEACHAPQALAETATALGFTAVAHGSASDAVQAWKRYKAATVLIAGSLYLAGEILKTHD
ncbi:MAG: bifunctional folylpolyglutamate synthase/dihydrofolate synthase [Azospirillum brasilense]|nr:MAG: bifunctional folylpolyglutamate synthase/dihydrofolate synthase [Azospirillum brasilense]